MELLLQFSLDLFPNLSLASASALANSRSEQLGVDPREWMEDILLRIPGNGNNRDALRELLPDRWAKQTN